MKEHPLITFSLLLMLLMIHQLVIKNDGQSHLESSLKRPRCKRRKKNYFFSVEHKMVPFGLRIHKKPAFIPVSDNFTEKLSAILNYAEKNINKVGQTYS